MYTQKQLDKIIEDNHKGHTDKNGKHRTMYECTQEQRRMERKIRQARKDIMVGKTSGDTRLQEKGEANLAKWEKIYSEFSESCGLPTKYSNTRI